jgi:hypothetical protein
MNVRGRGRGQRPGDDIDASPGGDDDGFGSPSSSRSNMNNPRNLPDTKAWKEGVGGAKAAWGSYLNILSTRFQNSSRGEQELYILRLSQAVTIGSAMLVLNFVYPFLPTFARVLVLPAVGVLAWLLGSKVVAPTMVARFERYLNPPM